jgi:hypothetical protein
MPDLQFAAGRRIRPRMRFPKGACYLRIPGTGALGCRESCFQCTSLHPVLQGPVLDCQEQQVGLRACDRCRATIEHPRPGQRFCSSGCRWEAWKARRDAQTEALRTVLEEALALNAAGRLAIETALERLGVDK